MHICMSPNQYCDGLASAAVLKLLPSTYLVELYESFKKPKEHRMHITGDTVTVLREGRGRRGWIVESMALLMRSVSGSRGSDWEWEI
jgi:hypothetical protein